MNGARVQDSHRTIVSISIGIVGSRVYAPLARCTSGFGD
jgi:hypothetical protein